MPEILPTIRLLTQNSSTCWPLYDGGLNGLYRTPARGRQAARLLLILLGLLLVPGIGSHSLLYAQNGPVCNSYTTKTTANGLGSGSTSGIYAVAGPTSTTIYAAQYNSPSGGGVSISTNGGASFTNYNSGMAETTVENVMAVGSKVYAATNGGLAVSTNGGLSYTNKTTANGLGSNTTIGLYVVGNTVYVGTTGGLSISTDGGNTFVNKTTANGLGSNTIRTVYVVGSTVYAGTTNGLSISTDGGNTFVNKTTANGLGGAIMLGVYVDGSTIYAGTDGGGLSISTNGGVSFTTKTTSNGLGSNGVRRVFAIGNTVYAATEGGLSISTNGGSSFTNYTTSNGLGGNYTGGLFVLNNVIYAGNSNGGVSFCSVPCTTSVSITATPSLTVASGQSTTLTASGASTYVWNTGGTTASINPVTSGTYSVTGTGSYNCTATASTTLTVTPVTLTTAATASSICMGGSSTLSVTPSGGVAPYTYSWSAPAGVTLSATNTSSVTATGTTSGVKTFTVTVTGTNTTPVSSTVAFTVNALPIASISGNLTICAGQSTVLTASGGTSYLWSTGETTAGITASAGTYSVTATSTGCSATTTATVTASPLPTVNIAANPSLMIQSGQSTTLTALGANSYRWSTGATTATISTSAAGTYSVTATTGSCSATTSVVVAVTSVSCVTPIVYAVTGGGTLCSGSSGLPIGLANSQTGVTYQLKLGSTNVGSPVAGTGSALSFGLQTEPGTYIVEATNDNCVATMSGNATLVITPSVTPSVSITSTVGTQPICAGTSVTFTATPTNGGTSPSYAWQKNGVTVGGNSTTYTDAGLVNSDVISCVLTSNASCVTSTIAISSGLSITVNTPATSIAGTLTVCAGQSTQLTASGGTSYLWNTGATTASITAPAGTYSVLVRSENCSATATAIVTETALPVVSITANPSLTIASGQSATLTASGADTYLWSTGASTASLVVSTGTYSVTGTSGSCSSVASTTVSLQQGASCVAYVPRNLVVSTSVSTYSGTYAPDGSYNGAPAWLGPVGGKFQVRIRWNGSQWELVDGSTVHSTVSGSGNNLPCSGWNASGNVVSSRSIIPTITQGCGVLSNIPVPAIAGQLTACGTQPTTLSASGGETYLWSTGETTSSISVSAGTYTVTAINAAGCSAQATKTVTLVPSPTATIVSNPTVCVGQSATMTASGGDNYLWNTGATTPTITAPAGSYTVTVTTNECSIKAVATTVVTAMALPVVSITANPSLTITPGQSTTLTASGADTYLWSTGASTTSLVVSAGTYSVTGTSGSCSSVASTTVSLQQGASCVAYVPRNLAVTVLEGGSSGGYSGTYVPDGSYNGAPAWTGPVGGKFQVRIRWNGTQWELVDGSTVHSSVPGKGNNLPCTGWTATGNVVSSRTKIPTITQGCGMLSNLPIPVLTGQLTACGTQPTTLSASGGETYLWSTGETSSSISVSAGTYTVTAINAAGCSAQATKTVTSVPLPTATIVSNATVCPGQSTTMTASGGDNYLWSTGATTSAITAPAGSYTVTVTTNGCPIKAMATAIVTAMALPIASITANPSLTITSGQRTTLTASGADTYLWSTGASTTSLVVSAGTYSVTGTSGSCSSVASTTVSLQQGASCVAYVPRNLVVSTPVSTYNGTYVPDGTTNGAPAWLGPVDGKIQVRIRWNGSQWELANGTTVYSKVSGTSTNLPCSGWGNGNVVKSIIPTITQGCGMLSNLPIPVLAGQLTACGTQPTTLSASGGETYLWSTGETTSSISVSAGTYTVTAINAAGCSAQATQTVSSVPLPTATIVSNATVCAEQSTQLTASGGSSYRWSTGATTPTITAPAGSYTVTVTNANGCSASATTTVTSTTLAAPALTTASRSLTTSATPVSLASFATADDGNTLKFTTSGGTLINPPVASIAQAGIQNFLVSQINASGCVSPTIPLSLTIIEVPKTVSASASKTQVCVSGTTSLSVDVSSLGAATKTYLWEGPAGVSYTGNTTASPTVTFSTAGVKSFTVTVNVAGVKYTGTISVTAIALPEAPGLTSASRSLTVSNTSVNLSDFATGTGTLRFVNTTGTQTIASLATAGVQSFSVTQTSTEGCVSAATVFSLTVVQPVVYPPASQTVCKGANLSLTMPVVSGNPIYDWYKGGTSLVNFIKVPSPTNILKLTNVQTTAKYYCIITVGSVKTTYGPYEVVVNSGCTARLAAQEQEPETPLSVVVAPNPIVGSRLQATVSGAAGQRLSVSAYSLQGLLIHQQTFGQAGEQQPIDWDMSQQPMGSYLLRAETDTQQTTVKLIHQ
ncbi:hypothetical protein [Spirosoma litoris]